MRDFNQYIVVYRKRQKIGHIVTIIYAVVELELLLYTTTRRLVCLEALRSRRRHRNERRRRMRSKRRRRSTRRPTPSSTAPTVVSDNWTALADGQPRRRRRRALVFDQHDIHRLHHDVDACYHRAVDACAWPQCNVACPRVRNPFTGREMDLVELLRAQLSSETTRIVQDHPD